MLALTGKDVLKFDGEVIQKQMGHLPEGKVKQAYDGSLLLDEEPELPESVVSVAGGVRTQGVEVKCITPLLLALVRERGYW